MIDFVGFAEVVERDCFAGWRSVLGRDNEYMLRDIDSVVFSMRDNEDAWSFSFALRYKGKWAQGKKDIAPVEYDVFGQDRSPDNIASDISLGLLQDTVGRLLDG